MHTILSIQYVIDKNWCSYIGIEEKLKSNEMAKSNCKALKPLLLQNATRKCLINIEFCAQINKL
jgi:hypothetical protein